MARIKDRPRVTWQRHDPEHPFLLSVDEGRLLYPMTRADARSLRTDLDSAAQDDVDATTCANNRHHIDPEPVETLGSGAVVKRCRHCPAEVVEELDGTDVEVGGGSWSGDRQLVVERREQREGGHLSANVMMTPAIGEDYWSYRVRLTPEQAVLGFPKFSTVGIGFASEEDWNTNLPYSSTTREIFEHIKHNKGDDAISDQDVLDAIQLIQAAIAEDQDGAAA